MQRSLGLLLLAALVVSNEGKFLVTKLAVDKQAPEGEGQTQDFHFVRVGQLR